MTLENTLLSKMEKDLIKKIKDVSEMLVSGGDSLRQVTELEEGVCEFLATNPQNHYLSNMLRILVIESERLITFLENISDDEAYVDEEDNEMSEFINKIYSKVVSKTDKKQEDVTSELSETEKEIFEILQNEGIIDKDFKGSVKIVSLG